MQWITEKEAYEMGMEAFFKGIPSSPILNFDFWEKANKIDGHDHWKKIIKAYSRGWHERNTRCPL